MHDIGKQIAKLWPDKSKPGDTYWKAGRDPECIAKLGRNGQPLAGEPVCFCFTCIKGQ